MKTILLVDDDVDMLQMLKVRLEVRGYSILMAQDGIQACQIVQKTPPDAIIIDYQMPAGDGVTVIKRIENLMGGAKPAIIFLTGSGAAAVHNAANSSPGQLVLHKPVEMNLIEEHLRRLLGE